MYRLIALSATLLLLVLTLASALPFSAPGATAPVKLTVAQGFIASFAIPVWIGRSQGIFPRNGLDVDVTVVNSTNAMQALLAGSVQIMLGSPGQGLSTYADCADASAIALSQPRCSKNAHRGPEVRFP